MRPLFHCAVPQGSRAFLPLAAIPGSFYIFDIDLPGKFTADDPDRIRH